MTTMQKRILGSATAERLPARHAVEAPMVRP
jgi:hypothetical protein